ncbi:MAG: TatD family hydrolase [Candidatus Bathyarchaeia archaeon]
MKLIDAHVHLSDAEYTSHIEELIADAKAAGVAALITNSMDLRTCQNDLKLAEEYLGLVYPALGVHPWNVNVLSEGELEQIIELITKNKNVIKAVGEIGLDAKYETVWEKQMVVFDKMLRLAETLELPVIIHSRGTTEKIIEMLPSYRLKHVLLHWFSYPLTALSKAMDNGYFITEGPAAVYSQGIRDVIEKAQLTQFLTETDGPVKYYKRPFNGELTKPSFIGNVVAAVSEIKKMQVEEVAEQIIENFEVFFSTKIN